MGDSLGFQKSQYLWSGISYISLDMNVLDMSRENKQKYHTEQNTKKKSLSFFIPVKKEGHAMLFPNADMYSGFVSKGTKQKKIMNGKNCREHLFSCVFYISDRYSSAFTQIKKALQLFSFYGNPNITG